jgi:hypothetical protein
MMSLIKVLCRNYVKIFHRKAYHIHKAALHYLRSTFYSLSGTYSGYYLQPGHNRVNGVITINDSPVDYILKRCKESWFKVDDLLDEGDILPIKDLVYLITMHGQPYDWLTIECLMHCLEPIFGISVNGMFTFTPEIRNRNLVWNNELTPASIYSRHRHIRIDMAVDIPLIRDVYHFYSADTFTLPIREDQPKSFKMQPLKSLKSKDPDLELVLETLRNYGISPALMLISKLQSGPNPYTCNWSVKATQGPHEFARHIPRDQLKCAVNPSSPCNDCSHFERIDLKKLAQDWATSEEDNPVE